MCVIGLDSLDKTALFVLPDFLIQTVEELSGNLASESSFDAAPLNSLVSAESGHQVLEQKGVRTYVLCVNPVCTVSVAVALYIGPKTQPQGTLFPGKCGYRGGSDAEIRFETPVAKVVETPPLLIPCKIGDFVVNKSPLLEVLPL